jgi:hypothetical protein
LIATYLIISQRVNVIPFGQTFSSLRQTSDFVIGHKK